VPTSAPHPTPPHPTPGLSLLSHPLQGDIYHARMFFGDVETNTVMWDIDCRPSDATFLALKVWTPAGDGVVSFPCSGVCVAAVEHGPAELPAQQRPPCPPCNSTHTPKTPQRPPTQHTRTPLPAPSPSSPVSPASPPPTASPPPSRPCPPRQAKAPIYIARDVWAKCALPLRDSASYEAVQMAKEHRRARAAEAASARSGGLQGLLKGGKGSCRGLLGLKGVTS
jgi:hypothetical protein